MTNKKDSYWRSRVKLKYPQIHDTEVSNMSYIHLTIEKRSQIEVLRKEGYSVRRIASLIGVHHSTVARELNRIEGEYSAIKAQQLAISKSSNKGRPTKLTPLTTRPAVTSKQGIMRLVNIMLNPAVHPHASVRRQNPNRPSKSHDRR